MVKLKCFVLIDLRVIRYFGKIHNYSCKYLVIMVTFTKIPSSPSLSTAFFLFYSPMQIHCIFKK